MKRKTVTGLLLLMIAGVMMMGLFGCGKAKYRVNFESEWDKECFSGVKDSYAGGERVKLVFGREFIGTDTDYEFYVDDERVSANYSESKGFIINFTMPDHDVTVKVNSVNSMVRG